MRLDNHLATRFVCPKCDSEGAQVDRFAATGTGISKLMNWQHHQFLAASCKNCGFTEIYNPRMLEGRNHTMDVLDAIFGG